MLRCLCYEAQLLVPVLQNLTKDTALFRPVVVSQVLGTDMKKHFDITSRFQVGLLQPMFCLSFSAGFVRPDGHVSPALLSMLCLSCWACFAWSAEHAWLVLLGMLCLSFDHALFVLLGMFCLLC